MSSSQEIKIENIISEKYHTYILNERMNHLSGFNTRVIPNPSVENVIEIVEGDIKLASEFGNSQMSIFCDATQNFDKLIIQTHIDMDTNAFWRKLTIVASSTDLKKIGEYLFSLKKDERNIFDMSIGFVKHTLQSL